MMTPVNSLMTSFYPCLHGVNLQYRVHKRDVSRILVFFVYMLTMAAASGNSEKSQLPVNISADEQQARTQEEYIKCLEYMLHHLTTTKNGTYCPNVWDDVLCWPDTAAGSVAVQPCPDYVNGFKPWENASRRCMDDGGWYFDTVHNRTWTDFRFCTTKQYNDALTRAEFIKSHMGTIKLMYNIGYGISLASLIVSVIIMIGFKRLHCPRNTIHINLFISFILRASISFMKENILVEGVGFPSDVITDGDAPVIFKNESSHWECKLFFTSFYYVLGANYMWIFAEAVYLHMLISVAVFSDRSGVKWYALLGWVSPVLFVLPWVIVRAKLEDEYCWNTHPTPGYFWIMRAPIVLSIVVNFVLFLNIIRVLFTKLNAVNSPEAKNTGTGIFRGSVVLFSKWRGTKRSQEKWHRFRLNYLHQLPNSRKNSHNLTYVTYLSKARESNASVSQFQESRDSSGNGFIKGVNSLRKDSATDLFPMKTRNIINITEDNVISESDELEPMICQSDLSETELQNQTDDFS